MVNTNPISDKTARPEWERKLESALGDMKAGRVQRFETEEEFLDYLKNPDKKKSGRRRV